MKGLSLFKNKVSVAILSIIYAVLLGSSYPVIKITYENLNIGYCDLGNKVFLAGIRFFIAAILIFIALLFIFKISIKISLKSFCVILLIGFLETTLAYYFFYIGLSNVSAMKGTILGTLQNFLVVIGAHFLYKEDKLNKRKVIGLITGFMGVMLVSYGEEMTGGFQFKGEGFLIISAIMSTLATFLVKEQNNKINPVVISAWQMFTGSIMLLIISSFMQGSNLSYTLESIELIVYISITSAIALTLWYVLLKYNNAGDISLYRFIIPVSGSLLSVLFIDGERFTINILVALILICMGIMLINTNYSSKK